jgi:hypothetical protein
MKLGIKGLVRLAQSPSEWDLGNSVLYALCRKYPAHDCKQAVIAKLWLIGRSYAAAIERREKFRKMTSDAFYTKKVAPTIIGSSIDVWIAKAARISNLDNRSLPTILDVHSEVTDLFKGVSGLEKRSLASKYLHFHLPSHFFIFDARAVRAIGKFKVEIGPVKVVDTLGHDTEYARFAGKCVRLQEHIRNVGKVSLSPRQLDNLLLKVHANEF